MIKVSKIVSLLGVMVLLVLPVVMITSCGSQKGVKRGTSASITSPKGGGKSKTVRLADNKRPEAEDVIEDVRYHNDTVVAAKIIREARKWIGTPYLYGGRERNGVDCSGLTMRVFKDAGGVSIPRNSGAQMEYTVSVGQRHLQPGDLVFFSPSAGSSKVSHVGLYIGDRRMIHASSSRGVMISSLDERYFATRYHSSGRVKEITYGFTGRRPPQAPGDDKDKGRKKDKKKKQKKGDGQPAAPPQRKPETQPVKVDVRPEAAATISLERLAAYALQRDADSVPDTLYIIEKIEMPVVARDEVELQGDSTESLEFIESIESQHNVEVKPLERDSFLRVDSLRVRGAGSETPARKPRKEMSDSIGRKETPAPRDSVGGVGREGMKPKPAPPVRPVSPADMPEEQRRDTVTSGKVRNAFRRTR